jgi:hypothetical protein
MWGASLPYLLSPAAQEGVTSVVEKVKGHTGLAWVSSLCSTSSLLWPMLLKAVTSVSPGDSASWHLKAVCLSPCIFMGLQKGSSRQGLVLPFQEHILTLSRAGNVVWHSLSLSLSFSLLLVSKREMLLLALVTEHLSCCSGMGRCGGIRESGLVADSKVTWSPLGPSR